jgi:hypothetical protein
LPRKTSTILLQTFHSSRDVPPYASYVNEGKIPQNQQGEKKMRQQRTMLMASAGILLGLSCAAFAADQAVEWRSIVGIMQGGNTVGTGTGQVTGGGQPWFARGGSAAVDLTSGQMQFEVQGLVLAGGNSIGTPGAVTQVKGTLVCDTTGSTNGNSTLVDTPLITLSAQGNARFAGQVSLPAVCTSSPNIAFLIRVSGGGWIAGGVVRETGTVESAY